MICNWRKDEVAERKDGGGKKPKVKIKDVVWMRMEYACAHQRGHWIRCEGVGRADVSRDGRREWNIGGGWEEGDAARRIEKIRDGVGGRRGSGGG